MSTQLELWQPLVGGGLIGVAVSALLLFSGRIAGVSGIVGGLIGKTQPGDRAWRVMFALGLLAGGVVVALAMPSRMSLEGVPSYGAVIAAGLLVGFGTRLSNGCTSGHGVCGISRFSIRSLAATVAFIAAGMVAVLFTRHIIA
jgi:uncharacterized membrane protein YedE/YeeE